MSDDTAVIEEHASKENDWVRARILKRDPPPEGPLLKIAERARDMAANSLGTRHSAYAVALQRALTASEPTATAKRLRLVSRIDGARETIRTDPLRLEQILLNLLSNAIRHSPAGAVVETIVEEAAGHMVFSVMDHGPGVPAELRDRIFEPFERFDPHSGLGTGLGLPVSRRLAAALGGALTVEDTAGGGATFILKIPS